MTVFAWHLVTRDQDYAFARPGLVTHIRHKLEVRLIISLLTEAP